MVTDNHGCVEIRLPLPSILGASNVQGNEFEQRSRYEWMTAYTGSLKKSPTNFINQYTGLTLAAGALPGKKGLKIHTGGEGMDSGAHRGKKN